MITFDRRKATIFYENGKIMATDIYAGFGLAANNPDKERDKMSGPLPAGIYTIAAPRDSKTLGPFVLDLVQIEGESYGRSLFRIHGDNRTPAPRDGSHGCIIAPRHIREAINKLTDRRIKVV